MKDARVGLRRLGSAVFKEPLCGGKLSTNGDKESLSCASRREELLGALGGSSGGGVGVRGGRGMGRFDAICARQTNGACAEPRICSSEECYSGWRKDSASRGAEQEIGKGHALIDLPELSINQEAERRGG